MKLENGVIEMKKYNSSLKYIFIFILFSFFTSSFAYSDKIELNKIERIIENYIKNNPDIIKKSLDNMQLTLQKKKFRDALQLLNDADNPNILQNNADITIYEFFDYNCGYCKSVVPIIMKAINRDKKVNFVFVEFPILSQDSYTASLATLAARKQNLYNKFHISLMKVKGRIDESKIFKIAKKIGLDIDKLKIDMDGPEIQLTLKKNREVAKLLKLNGTPGFIIGNTIYPGALTDEKLQEAIESYRKS